MARHISLMFVYLQLILTAIVSAADSDVSSSKTNGASFLTDDEKLLRVRRQGGNFVRIGRDPSSFVRIGKMDDEYNNNDANEKPAFPRSERHMPDMNRFIRIGRGEYSDSPDQLDDIDDYNSKDWSYSKIKRPSAFVRIGKSDSNEDFDKRTSGFVRIGKGFNNKRTSSFVRIGKNSINDVPEFSSDDEMTQIKRAPGFIRIGKSPNDEDSSTEMNEDKRMPGFVRIGKSDSTLFGPAIDNEHFDEKDDNEADDVNRSQRKSSDDMIEKKTSGFVRIGKSQDEFQNKRTHGFVRIGKGSDESSKRAHGFVRNGKSFEESPKRTSGFVRIGKGRYQSAKRTSGFVRIGKGIDQSSKRASGFVRIGKRVPGFVRIGKGVGNMMNKRVPGFVRIGKSNLPGKVAGIGTLGMIGGRFRGGRFGGIFRHDKLGELVPGLLGNGATLLSDDGHELYEPNPQYYKRAERAIHGFDRDVVRDGLRKKSSGFVRIGKSNLLHKIDGPIDKRVSRFVRIGKDILRIVPHDRNDKIKKNSGFVRIGKRVSSKIANDKLLSYSKGISGERMEDAGGSSRNQNPITVSRRAFVRIGKIPSAAFVPLNKDIGRMFDVPAERRAGYRRRSRNGQSSFVRIG